jgi:hypothetical protein
MADNQVEIIEGEVTQAFAPSKNDEGKWRPANIYIETAEGKVKISEFPKSDYDTRVTYEPIQMPGWYVSLGDVAHLAGVKVQVAASYKSTFEGTREYNKIQTFKVLRGLPTPQPTPATTATPAPAWGSLDERIAWNSAFNNANEKTRPPENIGDEARWLEDIVRRATLLYPAIRKGYTPPVEVEDAPEQPVQAQEPNVEAEPDVDYPGEDDIASNMGVFEA